MRSAIALLDGAEPAILNAKLLFAHPIEEWPTWVRLQELTYQRLQSECEEGPLLVLVLRPGRSDQYLDVVTDSLTYRAPFRECDHGHHELIHGAARPAVDQVRERR